jgi:uncharacterized membrane protein
MRSKVTVLGHPVHASIVHIPLGLFVMGTVFDVVYMVGGGEQFASVSFWNIAVGLVGAAAAAVFGAIDLFSIPKNTRAWRVGLLHGSSAVLMTTLFAISVVLRWSSPSHVSTAVPFVLELLAASTALFAGWLGGELVDRLGVGVHDGANLDAPSSLSAGSSGPVARRHGMS